MYIANHMLITTVEMVRVIHAGMKASAKFLWKSEGPQVRAAKPSIMKVTKTRRLDEDFFVPPPP